jgi:DNA-binding transcriptional LysR family regulator
MFATRPFPLRDIDVRHLMALEAVAEERSFGRAAQRLGFTQSAISQQVAALERIVGITLFDRPGGPRPVELTPAGQALLPHAKAVLERLLQASEDLEALASGTTGRLVIGTFQSMSVSILPEAIRRLRAERPAIEVRILQRDDKESLLNDLMAGESDLTFAEDTESDDRITSVHLFDDPYVVMSPWQAKPDRLVDLHSLHGAPMITEGGTSSCSLRIQRRLAELGIAPNYVFRTNDNTAMQAMVRAGMGHAIAALLAVDISDPNILVRAGNPELPSRSLCIASVAGRTLSPSTQRFIEIVQDVCAELVANRQMPAGLAAA